MNIKYNGKFPQFFVSKEFTDYIHRNIFSCDIRTTLALIQFSLIRIMKKEISIMQLLMENKYIEHGVLSFRLGDSSRVEVEVDTGYVSIFDSRLRILDEGVISKIASMYKKCVFSPMIPIYFMFHENRYLVDSINHAPMIMIPELFEYAYGYDPRVIFQKIYTSIITLEAYEAMTKTKVFGEYSEKITKIMQENEKYKNSEDRIRQILNS